MAHPATPESSPTAPFSARSFRPSRRTLLAAAWSVPAVTVATSSPAYATSNGGTTATQLAILEPRADIATDPNNANVRTLTGSLRVNNPTVTATQGLQVTFTMPATYLPTGTPQLVLTSTHGTWTPSGGGVAGSNVTATLTAQTQLPARSSVEIHFTLRATMPHLPQQPPPVEVRPSATNLTLANWVSFTPARP